MKNPKMRIKEIIDITKAISEDMVIYPGDPPVYLEKIKKPSGSILTKIAITSHTGTHLDMPKHMLKDGESLDSLDFGKVIGKCVVLDFTNLNTEVSLNDVEDKDLQPIVLIKTKNSFDKKFNKNFIYPAEEAVNYLISKQIKAIGTDSFSIDKFHSGSHPNHHRLLKNNIIIFENLDLSRVKEGEYFFIGLPLKIKACDGSPARAILLEE